MLREDREPLAGAKEEYSFYLKLGAGTLGARPESPCLTGSQELGQRQATDPHRGIRKRKSDAQSLEAHDRLQGAQGPDLPLGPGHSSRGSELGYKWHQATQNRLEVSYAGRGAPEKQGGPVCCSRGKAPALGRAGSSTKSELGGLAGLGPPHPTSGRPEGYG